MLVISYEKKGISCQYLLLTQLNALHTSVSRKRWSRSFSDRKDQGVFSAM